MKLNDFLLDCPFSHQAVCKHILFLNKQVCWVSIITFQYLQYRVYNVLLETDFHTNLRSIGASYTNTLDK